MSLVNVFGGQPVRTERYENMSEQNEHSVAPRCSTATNPMLEQFTTCGRCDEIHRLCAVVSIATVRAGIQQIKVCKRCLQQLAVMIELTESEGNFP